MNKSSELIKSYHMPDHIKHVIDWDAWSPPNRVVKDPETAERDEVARLVKEFLAEMGKEFKESNVIEVNFR